MPTQSLTPTSVQDKLDELYQLTNAQLATEALLIKMDFRSWMEANFDLTPSQKIFLEDMAQTVVDYFGEQCSFCFNHRLAIELDYPSPPAAPDYAKWPELTNSIVVAADDTGASKASGKLMFKMVYEVGGD